MKNPSGEIVKLYYDKNGYTRFSLWIPKNDPDMKNEKAIRYPYKTHRAVAQAFVPNDNPKEKTVVMHKNDIEDCNFYTNLQWGTPYENMQDKIRKGRLRVLHGSNKPDAIFNENDVKEICELLQEGTTDSSDIISLLGKNNKDRAYLQSYRNLIANIKRKHCWKTIIKDYNF